MKRAFIDTNILLDSIITERPRHGMAKNLFMLAEQGAFEAVASTQSIVDSCYSYLKGHNERKEHIPTIVKTIANATSILHATRHDLLLAASHFTDDFEDAVQAAVALSGNCDVIVTNDKTFDDPFGLPIVSPDEFCREFIEE